MIDEVELRNLAGKWKSDAISQVPDDYVSRGLESKFFKLDNEASGLMDCADELLDLLDRAAQLQRAHGSSALEILRRFHEAWENRQDDGVIDALMVEIGEFLRTADGV